MSGDFFLPIKPALNQFQPSGDTFPFYFQA
jgi:hypothetical protein